MSIRKSLLLSASQISKYRECPRKWAYSYVAGLKEPSSAAAALGTEIDNEQVQPYLNEGRPFDYTRDSGYIAAAGLAHLPEPKNPLITTQKAFQIPSPSWETHDIAYRGFKDVYTPDSRLFPGISEAVGFPQYGTIEPVSGAIPGVLDLKSTGDFKWAKTPKVLSTDVQAQLYAMNALVETGARSVDLIWLYLRTRGARIAKRVHLRVHADHVAEQFAAIDASGREIFEIKQAAPQDEHSDAALAFPLTLPPNPLMCREYGGCPYQSKCNLSPKELTDAAKQRLLIAESNDMNSPTIDLLANLKKKKSPDANTAPIPVAAINPPEKDLPPAPAVGVTVAADVAPVVEASTGGSNSGGLELASKPKRGRPKKQPEKDPIGADAHAATTPKAEIEEPAPATVPEPVTHEAAFPFPVPTLPDLNFGAPKDCVHPELDNDNITRALRAAAVRFIEVLDGAA